MLWTPPTTMLLSEVFGADINQGWLSACDGCCPRQPSTWKPHRLLSRLRPSESLQATDTRWRVCETVGCEWRQTGMSYACGVVGFEERPPLPETAKALLVVTGLNGLCAPHARSHLNTSSSPALFQTTTLLLPPPVLVSVSATTATSHPHHHRTGCLQRHRHPH